MATLAGARLLYPNAKSPHQVAVLYDHVSCYQGRPIGTKDVGKLVPTKSTFNAARPAFLALQRQLQHPILFCASPKSAETTLSGCVWQRCIFSLCGHRLYIARHTASSSPFLIISPATHITNIAFTAFSSGTRLLIASQLEFIIEVACALAGTVSVFSCDMKLINFCFACVIISPGLPFHGGSLIALAMATSYQPSSAGIWSWPVCCLRFACSHCESY